MRWFAVFSIIVLLNAASVAACTIFKTTTSERTLVGNTEDWVDANAKVWFLNATPEKHGRVFFGFANGWAQGGMNDQGLFFDGIAGSAQDWRTVDHRKDYPGNLCEKILEEATTVNDAIAYFEQYNFPSLIVGIYVFVDATGSTAAISYAGDQLKIETFSTASFAKGYRGKNAITLLNASPPIDIQSMAQILKKCQRRDNYSTQYSNVYDLHSLEFFVYPSTGSVNEFYFDLNTELSKGDHYYDLARLPEQVDNELNVDHKTRPIRSVSSSSLRELVGQYDSDNASFSIKHFEDRLLLNSEIIFDAIMSFEIHPVAEDEFCVRHLALEVNFRRDIDDKIVGFSLAYGGIIYECQKIR